MPDWVANELTIAGPKGAVEVLDQEVWSPEAEQGYDAPGVRFHRAVPAVKADAGRWPDYPGDGLGEKAWGCRAVGTATEHSRTVVDTAQGWLDAHPWWFHFDRLEEVLYDRLGPDPDAEGWASALARALPGDERPTAITYRFQTAWGAPERFCRQLGHRYPHLYIRLRWEGENAHVHGTLVIRATKKQWVGTERAAVPPHALLSPWIPMQVVRDRPRSEAPTAGETGP